MILRVEWEEVENAGFDAGGTEMLNYKGKPFTGFVVEYKNGILIAEEEYKDAFRDGLQRRFYFDGQLQEEYHHKYNRMIGSYKYWDESGNLILHIIHDNDGNEIERVIDNANR